MLLETSQQHIFINYSCLGYAGVINKEPHSPLKPFHAAFRRYVRLLALLLLLLLLLGHAGLFDFAFIQKWLSEQAIFFKKKSLCFRMHLVESHSKFKHVTSENLLVEVNNASRVIHGYPISACAKLICHHGVIFK